jgi:GrpB-like predicted nucleotidyltransferase (UPF0157 family)
MEIGLERGVVRLAPYSSRWSELYELEEQSLREAIGAYVLDIQHVGSTAIPGMVAKPILDVVVAIDSFEAAAVCIEPMERLGYEYRGENGIPRRHYFTKGEPRTHHVHMLEQDNPEWRRMIVFRDALRSDPSLAEEYAMLKKELAKKHSSNRVAYTDGKAAFVERVVALASNEKAT